MNNYDRIVAIHTEFERELDPKATKGSLGALHLFLQHWAPPAARTFAYYSDIHKKVAALGLGLDLEEFETFLRTQYPNVRLDGEVTVVRIEDLRAVRR